MRLSLLDLLVCFAALMSACGGSYEPGDDAVAVRIQEEYDESHGLYAEGSYSYVRVERLDGDELLEVRLEDGKADFRLEPGAYRFVSYQRVCEGNCDSLDHSSDECQRVIPVEQETDVRIFAGAGAPCRLAAQ